MEKLLKCYMSHFFSPVLRALSLTLTAPASLCTGGQCSMEDLTGAIDIAVKVHRVRRCLFQQQERVCFSLCVTQESSSSSSSSSFSSSRFSIRGFVMRLRVNGLSSWKQCKRAKWVWIWNLMLSFSFIMKHKATIWSDPPQLTFTIGIKGGIFYWYCFCFDAIIFTSILGRKWHFIDIFVLPRPTLSELDHNPSMLHTDWLIEADGI